MHLDEPGETWKVRPDHFAVCGAICGFLPLHGASDHDKAWRIRQFPKFGVDFQRSLGTF